MDPKAGPDEQALRLLREHFAQLRIGSTVIQEVTFDEEAVAAYAQRLQIEYPGPYVDGQGRQLVPPGLLFMGPAAAFGLKEGPPGARGGIFTQTSRRYVRAVRVGEQLRLEGTVSTKFEHRGRYYIEASWRLLDAAGVEVASGEEEHTLGMVREVPK